MIFTITIKGKSLTIHFFLGHRTSLESTVKQTIIPISKLGLFFLQILNSFFNDLNSPIVPSKPTRQERFSTIHFGEFIFVFHSVRINRFSSICNRLLVILKFLVFGFCISVRVSFFAFFRGNPVKWNIGYFIAVAENKMFVRFLRSGSVNVVRYSVSTLKTTIFRKIFSLVRVNIRSTFLSSWLIPHFVTLMGGNTCS